MWSPRWRRRRPGDVIHLGGDEVHELSGERYARVHDARAGDRRRARQAVRGVGRGGRGRPRPRARRHRAGVAPADARDGRPRRRRRRRGRAPRPLAGRARLPRHEVRLDDGSWAWPGPAPSSVRDAYEWEPGTFVEGVPEDAILGVEAPLWSETLGTIRDVEFMAFPPTGGRGPSWAGRSRRPAAGTATGSASPRTARAGRPSA